MVGAGRLASSPPGNFDENLAVTVFERGSEVVGLGVHRELRVNSVVIVCVPHPQLVVRVAAVNLPKEIMGYSDFPFLDNSGSRYCGQR